MKNYLGKILCKIGKHRWKHEKSDLIRCMREECDKKAEIIDSGPVADGLPFGGYTLNFLTDENYKKKLQER